MSEITTTEVALVVDCKVYLSMSENGSVSCRTRIMCENVSASGPPISFRASSKESLAVTFDENVSMHACFRPQANDLPCEELYDRVRYSSGPRLLCWSRSTDILQGSRTLEHSM